MDDINLATTLARAEQMIRIPKIENNPAKWMHERIVRSIIDFEAKLNEQEEIGARLVSFNTNEIFHIEDVGYWGPDIIIFYGRNVDGHAVELMQHVSQLSVLLVAMKKQKETARRIGYRMGERLTSEDD